MTLKRLSAAGTTILLLPLAVRSLVPSNSHHHHHLPPATRRRSRGSVLPRPFLFSSGISFCLLASAALSGFGTRTVSSSRKVPTYLDCFSRLARDAWECERVSLHQTGVHIFGGFSYSRRRLLLLVASIPRTIPIPPRLGVKLSYLSSSLVSLCVQLLPLALSRIS